MTIMTYPERNHDLVILNSPTLVSIPIYVGDATIKTIEHKIRDEKVQNLRRSLSWAVRSGGEQYWIQNLSDWCWDFAHLLKRTQKWIRRGRLYGLVLSVCLNSYCASEKVPNDLSHSLSVSWLEIFCLKQRDRLQRSAQAHLEAKMLPHIIAIYRYLSTEPNKGESSSFPAFQRNVQTLVHFAKDCTLSIRTMHPSVHNNTRLSEIDRVGVDFLNTE